MGENRLIEASLHEIELERLVTGVVPEVVKLVWVVLEVVKFVDLVAVVDDEFMAPVAKHRGISPVLCPAEARIERVVVLGADEVAETARVGLTGKNGEQRAALHGFGYRQACQLKQGGCFVGQLDECIASQASLESSRT